MALNLDNLRREARRLRNPNEGPQPPSDVPTAGETATLSSSEAQPVTVVDLLRRSWALFVQHLALLLVVSVITGCLAFIFTYCVHSYRLPPPPPQPSNTLGWIDWIAWIASSIRVLGGLVLVQLAASILAIRAGVLTVRGEPVTVSSVLDVSWDVTVHYLGTLALSLCVVLPLCLLLVPGIYAFAATSLFPVVGLVEGRWGISGLRRSRQLIKGHWWPAFIVSCLPLLLAHVVDRLADDGFLGHVINATVQTFSGLVLALLYEDLRGQEAYRRV